MAGTSKLALTIDGDRLIKRFGRFARIGALTGGGCERLAFSPEERAAHAEFARQAREAGLTVRTDEIGNTFARLEPERPSNTEPDMATETALEAEEAATGAAPTGGADRPAADGYSASGAHGAAPMSGADGAAADGYSASGAHGAGAGAGSDRAASADTDGAGAPGAHPREATSAQAILTGSHLDTVAQGGCYDGAAGVVCSLEALITLAEAQSRGDISLMAPIEVVAWANEEGARFAPATMGSAVYAGSMKLTEALAVKDAEGVTVQQALLNNESRPAGADATHPAPMAFLELHIEQGVELEQAGLTVAIVQGVQAQVAGNWTITGRSAHAGATPMHRRSDALVAASRLIADTQRIANEEPPGVATVGSLRVEPGSRNSVPGRVQGTIDIRHPKEEAVERMIQAFVANGKEAGIKQKVSDRGSTATTDTTATASASSPPSATSSANARADLTATTGEQGNRPDVLFDFEELWRSPQVQFAPCLIEQLEEGAAEAGIQTMRLFSAAGHDAVNLAPLCPTAMLFIPSRDGVSHHPEEYTDHAALVDGATVLAATLARIAGR